jgi:hypothetical protein
LSASCCAPCGVTRLRLPSPTHFRTVEFLLKVPLFVPLGVVVMPCRSFIAPWNAELPCCQRDLSTARPPPHLLGPSRRLEHGARCASVRRGVQGMAELPESAGFGAVLCRIKIS